MALTGVPACESFTPRHVTLLRRPLLRATVSFYLSLGFHRDNNPRRREEVDDGNERGWRGVEGNEVAAVRALARCRRGGPTVREREKERTRER